MNNNINGFNGQSGYPTQGNPPQGAPTQGYPNQNYQQPPVYQPPNYYAQYAQQANGYRQNGGAPYQGGYLNAKPAYSLAAEGTLGSMNIALFTIFSVIFGWICSRSLLVGQTGVGMTVMGAAFYLFYIPFITFKQKKKIPLSAWLLFIPQAAVLASFAVYSGGRNKFIGLLLSLAIVMVQTTLIAGCTEGRPFSLELLSDACATYLAYPFLNLGTTLKTVLGLNKEKTAKKKGVASKIGVGLLISIPVVIILVILLANADEMFKMWIDVIVKALNISLSRILFDIILTIITMLYVMPLVVTLRSGYHNQYEEKSHNRPIDAVIITTVLFAASLVYLVFVAVQFRYLFIGVPKELTYAEYCRRGFGELVFVIILTTAIIAAVCMLTRHNDKDKLPLYTKAALLLIAACDCVMIVSAVRRVVIYVSAYGMTVARFNASVIIAFMAICVIVTALKVMFEKLKVSAVIGSVVIVMLACYSCFNIDGFITRYNVDRYLENPSEHKMDVDYIAYNLSVAAIPELERLMDNAPDKAVSVRAKYAIAEIADDHYIFNGDDARIARWSWDRQRAVDIVDARGITRRTLDAYYNDYYSSDDYYDYYNISDDDEDIDEDYSDRI